MNIKIYKAESNQLSQWSGGTTAQIAIYPESSEYEKRNFQWRISSATVEQDETTFTSLPDFERILMVLEGEVILSFEGERITRLSQFQQDRFSGRSKTKSYGKIQDFNLIYHQEADAFLEILELSAEKSPLLYNNHLAEDYELESQFFYCVEEFALLRMEDKEYFLKKGDTLVLDCSVPCTPEIGLMGSGKTIHGIIRYNGVVDQEDLQSDVIQPGPASLGDFRIAAYLALTNFRGSQYLFKGRKEYWNDKVLQRAIGKIENTMIPFLIGIIGIIGVAAWGFDKLSPDALVWTMAFWILLDYFLLNPLLYFIILPKPIAAHRKKISRLSEKEKAQYEEERRTNLQAEKILKRYKITGRNHYQ